MTDLTEKGKAGELEAGWYYLKDGKENIYIDRLTEGKYRYFSITTVLNKQVIEILAPVPSYEELQSLEADRLAKNEGVEIVSELKAENAKLKDLLKQCIPAAEFAKDKGLANMINKALSVTQTAGNDTQDKDEVLK